MRKALLLAFGLLAASTTGCMDSPLNRQVISSQTAPVQFSGYYATPKQTIHLFIWNRVSGQFDPLGPGTMQVDANDHKGPDANGVVWYRWATTVTLPTQPAYWTKDVGNYFAAKVKATDGEYDLTSFDSGADTCWKSQVKNGGFPMMNACRSKASPEVTLLTKCGAPPLPACCNAASDCGNKNVCDNHVCKACGGPGDLCCGNTCDAKLVCKFGKCANCGEPGQTCCPGLNPCNVQGQVCKSNGTCGKPPCGLAGLPCCVNSSCNAGLTCQPPGVCAQQTACGKFGEACKSDEQCCSHVCVFLPDGTGFGHCSNSPQ